MEVTFDPAKDDSNIKKHSVSLVEATEFEWDEAITWADQRHDYDENRMIGLGYIRDRLFNVVFVDVAKRTGSSAYARPTRER